MTANHAGDSLSPFLLDKELARLLWQSGQAPDYSGSQVGMLALKREMELRGYLLTIAARIPGRVAACAFHPQGAPTEDVQWVTMEELPEPLAVSRAALLALRAGPG